MSLGLRNSISYIVSGQTILTQNVESTTSQATEEIQTNTIEATTANVDGEMTTQDSMGATPEEIVDGTESVDGMEGEMSIEGSENTDGMEIEEPVEGSDNVDGMEGEAPVEGSEMMDGMEGDMEVGEDGMLSEEGMGLDTGMLVDGMNPGTQVKDPLLSNWFFIGGISAGTLIVSIILGILLAKKRIKKGIELYED